MAKQLTALTPSQVKALLFNAYLVTISLIAVCGFTLGA